MGSGVISRGRSLTRVALAIIALTIVARPALAQGPYVAAAISGDIVRASGTQGVDAPGTGEAVSWSLRMGTPVASRFGVELEFVHPQAISNTTSPNLVTPLAGTTIAQVFPITVNVTTTERHVTLGTTAWVRQPITSRFSMTYLGGLGFTRTTEAISYTATGFPINILLPRPLTSIAYGAGAIVGTDARIDMTEHLQLVPGIRLQSLTNAWLVRPAVALAWQF